MAYSTNNPPYLIVPAIAGGFAASVQGAGGAGSSDCGGNLFVYRSTDAAATWSGAGYFTNGHKLGMRRGDIVLGVQVSTAFAMSQLAIGVVTAVTASSAATVGVSVSTF